MNNGNCANHVKEAAPRSYAPLTDIVLDNSQGSYRIVLDMPGVAEEDLCLKVEEQALTVSANTKSGIGGGNMLRCEAPQRSYHRVFHLSEDVDVERIAASLEAGVLTIELPKQAHKQPRKIPVRVVR